MKLDPPDFPHLSSAADAVTSRLMWGAGYWVPEDYVLVFDARRLVWLQLPGTAVGSLVAALLIEDFRFDWTPSLIGALLFLSIMSTVVALVWQFKAQREMSSVRAALIFCCEPVFAALTSWVFWGERFSAVQGLGAGLILAGMVVAVLGEARGNLRAAV